MLYSDSCSNAISLREEGAFRDALALRYGWQPNDLPAVCSCGKANSVQHALSCTKGGFPIYRHNDIRDLTASLMEEVSTSTEIEPALQPLTGEVLHGRTASVQDDSRIDIRSKGFWNQHQDAFFNVRVFNPLASSNQNSAINTIFLRHEKEKRRSYDQRIREVEYGSFTPLVFQLLKWLRCRLSFSLLRSSIAAIRGSRQSHFNVQSAKFINLATAEGHIPSA